MMSTDEAAAAIDLLRQYEEALAALRDRVHFSWLDALGLPAPDSPSTNEGGRGDPHDPRDCRLGGRRRETYAMPRALGLRPISFTAFEKTANRFAILPKAMLWRALRTRALLHRSKALRRCIDPAVRARLAAWIQPAVLSALLRDAPAGSDDGADVPLPLPVSSQDRLALDDALAEEGFWRFAQDGVWDGGAEKLIRLWFARESFNPFSVAKDANDASARRAMSGHSTWVLDRLQIIVPEAPWLCG